MNSSRKTATNWLSAIGYRLSAIGYRLILGLLITGLSWQVQAKEYTFKETQSACDRGYAAACFNLGVDYAKGNGVAKDEKKAAQLYDKACSLGSSNGCENAKTLRRR